MIVESDAPAPFERAYFHAVFLVPHAPGAWPERFAIITAHNPHGRVSPPDVNEKLDLALARHLEEIGLRPFSVTGASPDLRHQEAGYGFAVGDVGTAASISARFRQQAFYLVEGGMLFICVDASGCEWRVGPWQERLRTSPG